MTFSQATSEIRCEWGIRGVQHLAPASDAVIIVDVLSFSTCVSIAASRGAQVFPCRYGDDSRVAFATSVGAELAGPRGKSTYSLSPRSMLAIPTGTRLVLPSPNGSTLTLAAGGRPTFAGCLRNCRAVARAALAFGRRIAVIPAGERWAEDESLRFALEDLLGAGAIVSHLSGGRSAEAQAAAAAFEDATGRLEGALESCGSGRELRERGFGDEAALAAEVDVDDCAPILRDGAYQRAC